MDGRGWLPSCHTFPSYTLRQWRLTVMAISKFPGQGCWVVQLESNVHCWFNPLFSSRRWGTLIQTWQPVAHSRRWRVRAGSQGGHVKLGKYLHKGSTTQLLCHLHLNHLWAWILCCYLTDEKSQAQRGHTASKYQSPSLNLGLLPPNVIWRENTQNHLSSFAFKVCILIVLFFTRHIQIYSFSQFLMNTCCMQGIMLSFMGNMQPVLKMLKSIR